MKKFENTIILDIDHGFGNVKTERHILPSGVMCYNESPAIDNNLLIYGGKYYLVGVGHQPFEKELLELIEEIKANPLKVW